jgi:hypothetical protein
LKQQSPEGQEENMTDVSIARQRHEAALKKQKDARLALKVERAKVKGGV